MKPVTDDRDREILATRTAKLNAQPGPRVGDYVRFANGITRRISILHRADEGPTPEAVEAVQTCDSGTFNLNDYGVSCSAAMYWSVPAESLTETGETRQGDVWFASHDHSGRDNGVYALIDFRVFDCSEIAPIS